MDDVIPYRRKGDPPKPPAECNCQVVGLHEAQRVLLLTPACPVHRELAWPFLIRDDDDLWDDAWDLTSYDEEEYDDGIAY